MTVALFLSPHLDDAILSCAGRIQRHVARGERVVLLTVFSHADPDDTADWAARRREDEQAAARLGAQARWLGMVDAPFRDPHYADFDAITGPHAPGDAVWRERLTERLRDEVRRLCPTTLYAPLGVGDHVDHRLVHEAAAALDPTPIHYEDHPYALVPHAVRRRLDALGLASDDAPTPPPRRHRVRAQLEPLDTPTAALAERAIWDYATQAPGLFGTRERYRSLVRAHAEQLGTHAPRTERYWLDVTPP